MTDRRCDSIASCCSQLRRSDPSGSCFQHRTGYNPSRFGPVLAAKVVRSLFRLLIVILLSIIPLQMSYAAASGYCSSSEHGSVTSHFGHHVHNHVPLADGDNSAAKAGADFDCSLCQLACGHILTRVPSQPGASPHARPEAPAPERFLSVVLPDQIRPPLVASVA